MTLISNENNVIMSISRQINMAAKTNYIKKLRDSSTHTRELLKANDVDLHKSGYELGLVYTFWACMTMADPNHSPIHISRIASYQDRLLTDDMRSWIVVDRETPQDIRIAHFKKLGEFLSNHVSEPEIVPNILIPPDMEVIHTTTHYPAVAILLDMKDRLEALDVDTSRTIPAIYSLYHNAVLLSSLRSGDHSNDHHRIYPVIDLYDVMWEDLPLLMPTKSVRDSPTCNSALLLVGEGSYRRGSIPLSPYYVGSGMNCLPLVCNPNVKILYASLLKNFPKNINPFIFGLRLVLDTWMKEKYLDGTLGLVTMIHYQLSILACNYKKNGQPLLNVERFSYLVHLYGLTVVGRAGLVSIRDSIRYYNSKEFYNSHTRSYYGRSSTMTYRLDNFVETIDKYLKEYEDEQCVDSSSLMELIECRLEDKSR